MSAHTITDRRSLSPVAELQDVLWGQQIILRPANLGFSPAELRLRYSWSKDEELQYWSGSIPSGRTFDEFERMLPDRDWPADGRRRSFAILDRRLRLIGMVSCYAVDWHRRTGELGVYLGDRECWGQGAGTDAVSTLLRHLFADLHFECVSLNTYATNNRALRSYAKVGFQRVSTRRRFRPSVGYYREVRMELDRPMYLSLQSRSRSLAGALSSTAAVGN